MGQVEMVDKSGEFSSLDDIKDAIRAVENTMVKSILLVPPELAVMLTTIYRCLKEYSAVRNAAANRAAQVTT